MTANTTASLITGLIFLVLGLFMGKFYNWKKPKIYIPIILGLFLVYISTIGPLSISKRKVSELLKINDSEVESIIIGPSAIKTNSDLNLTLKDTLLVNRQTIKDICLTFNKAEIADDGFVKNPESVCRIQINFKDEHKLIIGVKSSGAMTCLTLDSKGESGWHYSNVKAIEFGKLLDKILK